MEKQMLLLISLYFQLPHLKFYYLKMKTDVYGKDDVLLKTDYYNKDYHSKHIQSCNNHCESVIKRMPAY